MELTEGRQIDHQVIGVYIPIAVLVIRNIEFVYCPIRCSGEGTSRVGSDVEGSWTNITCPGE